MLFSARPPTGNLRAAHKERPARQTLAGPAEERQSHRVDGFAIEILPSSQGCHIPPFRGRNLFSPRGKREGFDIFYSVLQEAPPTLASSPCSRARNFISSGREAPSDDTSRCAASTSAANSSCSHWQSREIAGSSCMSAGRKLSAYSRNAASLIASQFNPRPRANETQCSTMTSISQCANSPSVRASSRRGIR